MTFQKDGKTFQSKGTFNEQVAAAEEHFGVTRRDGCWNMLGALMVWTSYEQLGEMGID